ncbi:SAM-dependent methyltransferase [Streptomyces sp. NPDC057539]|uniref:SAM-dependent methyltransferase n=1 Tax=Streptomyces sp. NPDC057539 TaxID=3346159 RepID=UPI00369FF864
MPVAVDVYCCQGGATRGYQEAGFRVVGVDLDPQPRYVGDEFHQADAITWLDSHSEWIREHAAFVHASPPCQLDSDCQRIMGRDHPDLIEPTREVLDAIGIPYVIENVRGALPKLKNPVELCGAMFSLRTYRHRYFEAGGWTLTQPQHPAHAAPQTKMGRPPRDGEFVQAIGNFSGVAMVRDDWGVTWMNRDGIRESIPPAYAEYIGRQFLGQRAQAAA